MKCYCCGEELIWGGDHDVEDEDSDYSIETNLSCPKCDSFVLVYHPKNSFDPEEID